MFLLVTDLIERNWSGHVTIGVHDFGGRKAWLAGGGQTDGARDTSRAPSIALSFRVVS
jgi:hypothetical protein